MKCDCGMCESVVMQAIVAYGMPKHTIWVSHGLEQIAGSWKGLSDIPYLGYCPGCGQKLYFDAEGNPQKGRTYKDLEEKAQALDTLQETWDSDDNPFNCITDHYDRIAIGQRWWDGDFDEHASGKDFVALAAAIRQKEAGG